MNVVVAGQVVVDWLSVHKAASLDDVTAFERSPGGSALNTAVGLSRLGVNARLVGKVGADFHGDYIKAFLSQEKVDSTFLQTDSGFPTAQCYCLTTIEGKQKYHEWPLPHAAQMLEAPAAQVFASANAFHTTGISLSASAQRQAILQAIALAKQLNCLISFDAASVRTSEARNASEQVLSSAHILKLNQKELAFWSALDASPEEQLKAVFERYKPIAIFATQAAQGSLVASAQGIRHISPFAVEAKDEIGSGDAYVSGVLAFILKRFAQDFSVQMLGELDLDFWQEVATYASAVGALNATCLGAVYGLPSRLEVESFLSSSNLVTSNLEMRL